MAGFLSYRKETVSQTAGPYVQIGCTPNAVGLGGPWGADLGAEMITGPVAGRRISLSGTVFDGIGAPLRDAMVEIWQADAAGLYPGAGEVRGTADPYFTGFGRAGVDAASGLWRFETIKPGAVPFPDGRMQAPHVTVWIVARGINLGLHTRLYFPDEENDSDPVLTRIEHQSRIPTLIAKKDAEGAYRFDVRLQGAGETVFFDC